MKPILKQILVPSVSAIAGGLVVFGALKFWPIKGEEKHLSKMNSTTIYDDILKNHDVIRNQFDNLFNDDFFRQSDPFEQMRKMREDMEKRMQGLNSGQHFSSNPFDNWFSGKFGGGTVNDISKREDENAVYYDIKVEDVNGTSINTKIENGYITITGTTEKKNEKSNSKEGEGISAQSYYKSSFNRTFPLPEHVDQNGMKMTSEKNKIVLMFPKVKA